MTPRTARIALGALLLCIYGTLSVARTISNALRDAGLLRASVATAFVLAGIAVVLFVARTPALRNVRTLVATLAVALVYAAVIFPMSSPEEKLHFLEYGAVGVLAFFSMPPTWLTPRRFAFAVLFTLAAGWLDEGIQALLPSRHYDLRDVGFNALAGTMALMAFGLIRWTARPVSSGAVLLLCVGLATPANAVIQRVYDVPGLTLKAEVIVVAVRQESGSFKVRQSLRGGLTAGAELTVSTLGYAVTWNAAEPEVMLFLERGGADGMQLVLVDSGLRQRGFRFEQRRNPGSYEAIEDSRDFAALSREVQSTLAKVAVLEELADETDLVRRRKLATALVPFEVQPEAHAFTFNDELAHRVLRVLVSAGDLEGMLTLQPRDHTTAPFGPKFGTLEELLAYAEDRQHPDVLRARALVLAEDSRDLPLLPDRLPRITVLLGDAAPLVRSGAAFALLRAKQWSSSDTSDDRRMKAQATRAKKALTNRFLIETDVRVLWTLVQGSSAGKWKRAKSPQVAAAVQLRYGMVVLSASCLAKHQAGELRLVANEQLVLQAQCEDQVTAERPKLAAGKYALTLAENPGGEAVHWPMGMLVVTSDGEWLLE